MDIWGLCFLIAIVALMFHHHILLSGVSWYDSFSEDGGLLVVSVGAFLFLLAIFCSLLLPLSLAIFDYVRSVLKGQDRFQRKRNAKRWEKEFENDPSGAVEKMMGRIFLFGPLLGIILYYPAVLLWIKFLD